MVKYFCVQCNYTLQRILRGDAVINFKYIRGICRGEENKLSCHLWIGQEEIIFNCTKGNIDYALGIPSSRENSQHCTRLLREAMEAPALRVFKNKHNV